MTTTESILIHANRDAGLTSPKCLPNPWDKMNATEQATCLWYVRNVLSYFDKNAVARHIIGKEILANESAGKSPVMTEERAKVIWDFVFRLSDTSF
jgi:hypothetical protein